MKKILLVLIALCPLLAKSQINLKRDYFLNGQVAALFGCNDCAHDQLVRGSFSATNGLLLGEKLRVGIGTGVDSYQNWRTLPVFGTASWDLIGNRNSNALFARFAYGWAHPWFVKEGTYQNYANDPFSSVSGQRMINAQIGYRISYNNLKLAMSIGYKYQQISYKKTNSYPDVCPACATLIAAAYLFSEEQITQGMNRVEVTMSMGWK